MSSKDEYSKFKKLFRQMTLGIEGEKLNTNEPAHVGGKSKYGITQSTLDAWQKENKLPSKNVADITLPEAENIAYNEFYAKPKIDKLPDKVREFVYDFGYQSSPQRAIKYLQSTVGADADGILGPKTIKAINDFVVKNGDEKLVNSLADSRLKFLEGLAQKDPYHAKNFQGYVNRVTKMRDMANTFQY